MSATLTTPTNSTLSYLAPSSCPTLQTATTTVPVPTITNTTLTYPQIPAQPVVTNNYIGNKGNLLLWFLIIAVIAYLILYIWKPTLLQRTDAGGIPTGVADPIKVLIAAIIVALIIVLLIWLFTRCRA